MKKRLLVGAIAAGVILLGAIGSTASNPQSSTSNISPSPNTGTTPQPVEKITPVCDGETITKSCTFEGIEYSTYIYHAAVEEKFHNETSTTYEQKITSYCTLCNDGTYSPSCATGRGACSHHGGVDQWNAPRYSNVPVSTTKKVIDTPNQEAYYEKIKL